MNRDTIKEKIEKIDFFLKNKDKINEYYMNLSKAIYQNQAQSIIRLSKIITRYHIESIQEL